MNESILYFTESFNVKDGEHFYNRAQELTAGRLTDGPGTHWHGRECATTQWGKVWGWMQDKVDADPEAQQWLAYFDQGQWNINSYASSPASLRQWRQVCKCAGVTLSCGTIPATDDDGNPIYAMVWGIDDGRQFSELACDYFPYYLMTCVEDGEEVLYAVARKVVSGLLDNSGEHILRIVPRPRKVCAFWDDDLEQFTWTRSTVVAAGMDITKWNPYLWWQADAAIEAGGIWVQKDAAPADATVYLQLVTTTLTVAYRLHAGQTMPYDPS